LCRSVSRIRVHPWSTIPMIEISDIQKYLDFSSSLLEKLRAQEGLSGDIESAVEALLSAVLSNKPILTCGNGGSASDALHISGELVGRFRLDRRALNVVCLNSNVTVMTAWANDISFDSMFARQVQAHGCRGGVLWGLSTSGNSTNVIKAFEVAKQLGMSTIAMTGSSPGALGELADCILSVPAEDAPSAQNLHVVLYHFICEEVERLATEEQLACGGAK